MDGENGGSDIKDSHRLDRLRAFGVEIYIGHDPRNVKEVNFVARSTAISDSNVECLQALKNGTPLLSREKVLSAISELKKSIAVAGTHGKTTTSSMLSLLLREAGLKPSFIIGGEVNEIGTGAVWDDGELLVVEADESDASFLGLKRDLAIITNLEEDHLAKLCQLAVGAPPLHELECGSTGWSNPASRDQVGGVPYQPWHNR